MESLSLTQIAEKFEINGKVENISKLDGGHINKTYRVDCIDENGTKTQYILQLLNKNVFPNINAIMNNYEQLWEYSRQHKGTMPAVIFLKSTNKEMLYDGCYRMTEFVKNTVSFETTESLDMLEEVGKAVGEFEKCFNEFDASKLIEVIPKFHDTRKRFLDFKNSLQNNENIKERGDRFEIAKEQIDYCLSKEDITGLIVEKIEEGKVPLHVCHNDTKLSNILFDKESLKAVTLIDFDTVMPGSLLYDYGEGIRTSCTTSREDEEDLSKVVWQENRCMAFTKGFLDKSKEIICKEELELLGMAPIIMAYENGMRFLTDYLNGDIYFNVNEGIKDHNLKRAKMQFELTKQMEQNLNKINKMIKNL